MNSAALQVSVVVPCHNEQDNVGRLAESVRAALEPLAVAYEIVFTDDASTDQTWPRLQQLARSDPHIRAQRFDRNGGQSAALWAGLQSARGQILITLDADLQNDPQDLPRFLEAIQQADCVCGSRVAARRGGDSLVRVLSSRIANRVRNKLSGEEISDAGCCYRAMRRECLAAIRPFRGFHRFLPTLLRMEGFRVIEIPVRHHPRRAGASHYGIGNRLFSSFADLLAVRWMKSRALRYSVVEHIP